MTGAAHGARWSPVRHAWRSTWRHRRGQALAMVAMSALVTACTVFAPVYDRAMQQALVDTLLAAADPADRAVVVVSESAEYAGGATDSRDPLELERMLPDDVAVELLPAVRGRTAVVAPVEGEVPPTGLLVWRDGGCAHVRLLSGSCPDAAGEILVSEADEDIFGLGIGTTQRLEPAIEDDPRVRLEVVGTYEPVDDAWWQGERLVGFSSIFLGLDPSANHDAWLTTEETFVDAPLLTGETSQAGASLPTSTSGVDDVVALGEQVGARALELEDRAGDVTVRTGIDDLAEDVRGQVRQAHRTVPLLLAPMAVLSVFVLWLVLAAAAAQRRGEVAVARLRGRGPSGAAALLLVDLLPPLLLGVVPGAVAALLAGRLVERLLPGDAPTEVAPGVWTAVLLAAVVLVLMTLAAAVRTGREPLHEVVRSGATPSRRWALGAPEEFAVAAVGTGVLAFVTGSLQGPFALAGPALLALLTGLLLAHVTVPAARAAGRRLLTRGRLVPAVSLLETARRRETRAVIAVITVASALSVFAADALAIGERTRLNASQHEAGAPVVLTVAGGDLDAVRASLAAADPTGRSATPVVVTRDETLAVEPEAFSRIAFFPRGAPTAAQWRAIAPPDVDPVVLTGTRVSLDVLPDQGLTGRDIFDSEIQVTLALVVTSASGVRRTIPLGPLPAPGERQTLVGRAPACEAGCRWAGVQLTTAQRVEVRGTLDLGELRVDGRLVEWGSAASDWNATEAEAVSVTPVDSGTDGVLRLDVDTAGEYPVAVTPAWVPRVLPVLVPEERRDEEELEVAGVDGSDRAAEAVGRLVLVPSMTSRSALVDLDAASRGAAITSASRLEVWIDDDPGLVDAVQSSLEHDGITVTDTRRYETVRQANDRTVASWSLALGAAVAPAVLLLALLVLGVLALIGGRARARDLAVLRLHGVDRSTTARLSVWASLPPVLLAVAGGVAAGLLGAVLAMPDVAFFPAPPTVPVVDTSTSWPAVLGVAGVCLVALLSAAALTGVLVARRAHLARVKDGS